MDQMLKFQIERWLNNYVEPELMALGQMDSMLEEASVILSLVQELFNKEK